MAGIVAKAKAEVSAYVQAHIGESQLALNIKDNTAWSEFSSKPLDKEATDILENHLDDLI